MADAWTVEWHGIDLADEGRREALCTLGNGRFATRGAAPESGADGVHNPGTYAAGCYNRLSDEIAGVTIENESMVNLPNWLTCASRSTTARGSRSPGRGAGAPGRSSTCAAACSPA